MANRSPPGLRNNPALQGRVAVQFTIRSDVSVSGAKSADSNLADSNVVSCIVRASTKLSFPMPEKGVVSVVYPLDLSPGD